MPTPSGGGTHILINDNINDENISTNSTWSSDKINGTFAQLSLAAQDIVDNMESSLKEDYMQKIKNAAPVNLLDNSDFTNPVNQRGQNNYSSKPEYCIDRWYTPNSNLSISIIDSGVNLSSVSSDSSYFIQKIEGLEGKALTAALCLEDGSVYAVTATIPLEADKTITLGALALPIPDSALCIVVEGNTLLTYYQLKIGGGQQITCKWAALYEGEYTAETLPKYRPKGYGVELLECQRYYRRYTNVGIGGNNIFLTGAVSSSATGIYCSSLNNLPMRIPSPTINFTGIAIIRTIDGYETTTGSAGYTDPIVDLYYDGSDTYLAPLRFRKQDGSAWGITNNTPVHIMIKSGILEISADL